MKSILEEILKGQSEERNWHVIELEIKPDHIHLFLSVPPNQPVAGVVNQLKGNSSIQLRRIFPDLKAKVKKHLWAKGYYVSTAGFVSQEQVQKYILAQQKQLQIQRNRKRQGLPQQKRLVAIPPQPKGCGFLAVA